MTQISESTSLSGNSEPTETNAEWPATTTTTERIQTARAQTLRSLVKAEIFLDRELPTPQISFNLRGKTAGIFQYQTLRGSRGQKLDPNSLVVRLNHTLLTNHTDIFLREVIPHEISHLAVYCHYGTTPRPHGKEWQRLMELCFGLEAKIYHNFPVKNARQHPRPYAYQCSCTTHYFTARRHQNRLKGNQYVCHQCRGVLAYIGKHVQPATP